MEKQKQDFGNTLKQFKDSISSRIARLEPLVETVNNLSTKESSNSFNNSSRYWNANANRSNFRTNNNYTRNNADMRSNSSNSNNERQVAIPSAAYINACLHCAKPNHQYFECNNATDADKNAIRQQLKDRKFDFNKLHGKAKDHQTLAVTNTKNRSLNMKKCL